jgi:hypothetical protein
VIDETWQLPTLQPKYLPVHFPPALTILGRDVSDSVERLAAFLDMPPKPVQFIK